MCTYCFQSFVLACGYFVVNDVVTLQLELWVHIHKKEQAQVQPLHQLTFV